MGRAGAAPRHPIRPGPAAREAAAAPARGWLPLWLPRLGGAGGAAAAGDGGRDGAAAGAPPGESYLDDPVEQRRYALRWALTFLVLGVLAIGLVWALGSSGGLERLSGPVPGAPSGAGLTRALPGPPRGEPLSRRR